MIVFYVSGHGYGHATRTGAVIANLLRLAPDIPVSVRTEAPPWAFPREITYSPAKVDFRVVEAPTALSLDTEGTAQNVRHFCEELPQIVRQEVEWLGGQDVRLMVADIPFLPGLLSRRTSIPAVAVGNFTWHWILEPLMPDDPALACIQDGYAAFRAVLRMPWSSHEGWSPFRACVDIPLVTPLRSSRSRPAIQQQLGLASGHRPIVLVAGRSQLSTRTLAAAAEACRDFEFLATLEVEGALPPNVHLHAGQLTFSDLLRASDVVLGKLGYSTAAECVAEGKRLLYPERSGFRETEILRDTVGREIPAVQMDRNQFFAGDWKPALLDIMRQPYPTKPPPETTGAALCARLLLQYAGVTYPLP